MKYETVTITCDNCGRELLTCVPSEVEQEWESIPDCLTRGDRHYCARCAEQIMAEDDDEEDEE